MAVKKIMAINNILESRTRGQSSIICANPLRRKKKYANDDNMKQCLENLNFISDGNGEQYFSN